MDKILKTEEFALIKQASDGDQDAFCSLVLFYEGSLVTYLYAFLGDWESARDIAQETFVSAYYALPDWKAPNSYFDSSKNKASTSKSLYTHPLAPWLYRIATNKALTFLKQSKNSVFLLNSQDLFHTSDSAILATNIVRGETIEDKYIIQEILKKAFSLLNEEDAICIVLRFVLDEKYSEIAERIGISKEAVRKRISRGLAILRSVIVSIDKKESF